MDTKDLIIIAGSIFFVLIVGHGLWVARRARRNDIRMDIEPSDGSGAATNEGASAELPNGGARVISQALRTDDAQAKARAGDEGPLVTSESAVRSENRAAAAAKVPQTQDLFGDTQPLVTENRATSSTTAGRAQGPAAKSSVLSTAANNPAQASDSGTKPKQEQAVVDRRRQDPQLEELLILGVMAKSNQSFGGEELIAALRGQGLKFGDMGIFHRLGDDQGERLFSVANAVEPGTFDLSDLPALSTPGLTFFMQLPVPGDALETLEDMILSARTVAAALGGDVKDDTMSALTGQTVEHMKQRVADFARKQLTASSDG
ncbi:MAG: cell division protein ZipA [Proteobacteria bacterium]|nr:cell division protein ZipA [Pseudomonadota bacterium]